MGLTNEERNKETNEIIHGRYIRFRWDLNQGPHTPKANTITIELKRILLNKVVRYMNCI